MVKCGEFSLLRCMRCSSVKSDNMYRQKVSSGLAGHLANGIQPELFKNFALHFATHPSLLFTDTVELSVPSVSLFCGDGYTVYSYSEVTTEL